MTKGINQQLIVKLEGRVSNFQIFKLGSSQQLHKSAKWEKHFWQQNKKSVRDKKAEETELQP